MESVNLGDQVGDLFFYHVQHAFQQQVDVGLALAQRRQAQDECRTVTPDIERAAWLTKNNRNCLAFYFFVLYFLSAMQTKYHTLLIAILILAAHSLFVSSGPSRERVLAQPGLAQEDGKLVEAPIQTDKKSYKVTVTKRSVKFAINYSYVNRTGGVVFLPSCKKPYRPTLEKKIEGRWIPVVASIAIECGGSPVRIGPEKTYRNSYKVEAFLPGNNLRPELKIDPGEIEGVYRLVHVFSGQNRIFPLGDRISNEFNLTR